MVQREIFLQIEFVTIYLRSTLHEKTEFLQERQYWLGRLSIPLRQLF